MKHLKKIVFETTKSELIRSLANKCKTEKQLSILIKNLRISKALKNKDN